jgi:hypothetical protein
MAVNYIFLVLLVLCCAGAFIWGGGPERAGMAIYAAGSVATYILVITSPIHYRGVEVGVLTVDLLVFLGFILVALRAERYWPLWVSALVGVGVLGHLAMLLHPRVIPSAYAAVLSMWSYPILLVIAAGTAAHRRRLKRNGADPSWTRSSGPAGPPPPAPGPTP